MFPLIQAYTSATGFSKEIIKDCITFLPGLLRVGARRESPLATSIFYIIVSFNFDPILRPAYNFTGVVYRGLRLSSDYIRTYKKNQIVVNRPFLSTSQDHRVAESFFSGSDGTKDFRRAQYTNEFLEASLVCTYKISRPQTRALDIGAISEFPGELEILIMPISAFRIIDIDCDLDKSKFHIILEDCDLPSEHDPTPPIIRCDFAEVPGVLLIGSIVAVKTA